MTRSLAHESSQPLAQSGVAGCMATLLLCGVAGVSAAPARPSSPASTAGVLLSQLDLSRPELAEVAALARQGKDQAALARWRDLVVLRLRRHDFGKFGWHGYALHPRPAGAVDMLTGIITREAYLNNPNGVDFVDIFGMSGPPGRGQDIRWFVDLNGPLDWGSPELAALDTGQKILKTNYANFELFKSFTGRYWHTGNEAYLQKALEIMSDFARNHRRRFWADYAKQPFGDKEVREFYRADWRLNTNGLGMGWRAKNFLKNLAGLSKCLSSDKPAHWEDVLKPVRGTPTREELDRIPADQLADIALSLMRDHTGKLLWFCLDAGAVPNQRAEGLKALAFMSVIFPNFKTQPQLVDYVTRGYEDYLDGNFLPDGGSLEQSFNYNKQDKEGLEELIRFFGDNPPPYAKLALEKIEARRRVDDGLQTPLGGLPQVGNHHQVLGKAVWESAEAAERYWATDLPGKEALRPQPYTSRAYPYSGYYAMRSGWSMKDLYLFFMAGRPQSGHSMRDNNAVQITAYGRQLVVCGGSPTYGQFRSDDARGADAYLSEASSFKNNTVLVDGKSQAKHGPKAKRAYKTPVRSRWHTSARFDLVDGNYALGYCDYRDGREADLDLSVEHYRSVTFVKEAKLWVMEDRMHNRGDQPHRYTQVWNFLPRCEAREWTKTIAGFNEAQFAFDAERKHFTTADPNGPNLEFYHFGPRQVEYRKYFGQRGPWLGWFAAGIGDARPAPDVHVNWQSTESETLLTLLAPRDTGQASPVTRAVPLGTGETAGFEVTLRDGARVRRLCAAKPTKLNLAPLSAVADSLLVFTNPKGDVSGLVCNCESFSVGAAAITVPAPDFEFVVQPDGKVATSTFTLPLPPKAEEPTSFINGSAAHTWRPRPPDVTDASGLEPGLRYQRFKFAGGYIRLYDLMLRKPVETGECDSLDLTPWAEEGGYGVKWEGYLRLPRDGRYHFHCQAPSGARLFLYNPSRDLEVPAVVHPNYVSKEESGTAELRAGFHQMQIHYVRFPQNANTLTIEVDGPGLSRRPLPRQWFYRQKRPKQR